MMIMERKLFKFVMVFLFGGLSLTANAQKTIDVLDFNRDDADLTARVTSPVRDNDEGKLCALIRVETALKDIEVKPDMLGIVKKEEHPGEVWLYVPYGAKSLKFYHDGYYSLTYEYEMPIEEGVVYKLKLKYYDTPPTDVSNTKTQLFVMTLNPENATVKIDGMEVQTQNGVYASMMNKGEHHYIVKASQYEDKEGDFILGEHQVNENVKLEPLFGMFALFTLPDNNFNIYVNGQFAGTSPYKSDQLKAGNYEVHIEKNKYYPVDTIIRLGYGDSQIHTIKLTSKDDSIFYDRILGGRNLSFGITAGYIVPFVSASASGSFSGSPINYSLGDSRENSNYSSLSGFTAGMFADIRLYKNLYLIAGLNYTLYKYKNTFSNPFENRVVSSSSSEVNYATVYNNSYEEKYTHHMLDLTVMASYRFVLTKKSSLHVNAGPFLRYNMSAKMNFYGSSEYSGNTYAKNIYDNSIYFDTPLGSFSGSDHASADIDLFKKWQTLTKTVEASGSLGYSWDEDNVFEKSPFKRLNYGLKFGLTYELRGFQVSANYAIQLSNMANNEFWESTRIPLYYQTGENAMSGYKHRLHSLEINVGYVLRY